MADAISAVSNLQLGFLQSPEIARETVPITAQAELANSQAAALIAKDDKDAAETVQRLQQASGQGVPDALQHQPDGQPRGWRQRRGRQREPVTARAVPLAAAHPRGLGGLVDYRA